MVQLTLNQIEAAQDIATPNQTFNPLRPVSDALGRIFVTDQEQTRTQKTRSVMGELVADLSDEELEVYMTEFQYLIDEWLDDFECQAFNGQTLKQVLGQE